MSEVQRLSQQIGGTHVTYLAHDFREPVVHTISCNDNESDEETYERVGLRLKRRDTFWSMALNIAAFMVAFAAAGVIYHG